MEERTYTNPVTAESVESITVSDGVLDLFSYENGIAKD
jgi:hypothetical protein